jgi:hypothetical protein
MLTESKKSLLQSYKEAKKRVTKERISKIDSQNQLYQRVNAELDLNTHQQKENTSGNL